MGKHRQARLRHSTTHAPDGPAQSWALQIVCGPAQGSCPRGKAHAGAARGLHKRWAQVSQMRMPISGIVATCLLCLPTPTGAICVCAGESPPSVAYQKAQAVFAGIAVKVDIPNADELDSDRFSEAVYYFETTHVWKGPVQDTIAVSTPVDACLCGTRFEIGRHYLLYAHGGNESLRVGVCNRLRRLESAVWDTYVLGRPMLSEPGYTIAHVSLEDLFGMMESSDENKRSEAAHALGHDRANRDEIIPFLVRIIRGGRGGDALLSIRALGMMGRAGYPAADDLVWASMQGAPGLRLEAYRALWRTVSYGDFFPHFMRALSDPDDSVRAWFAGAAPTEESYKQRLSRRQRRVLLKRLVELTRDMNPRVRAEATASLGHLREKPERILPLLEQMQRFDRSRRVRDAAMTAAHELRQQIDNR